MVPFGTITFFILCTQRKWQATAVNSIFFIESTKPGERKKKKKEDKLLAFADLSNRRDWNNLNESVQQLQRPIQKKKRITHFSGLE
jgi:hypothetical protein